ncbi:hypothetical protein CRUP_019420, partial [Coryphaenoides rupestris]
MGSRLNHLPWFEVFYKLLNNLADYLTKGQTNEITELLASLYKQSLPLAAESVTLQMVPYFKAPDPRSLPSIPESRNLTELMVAVDVRNLLQLYASILFERRILIFASKLSTVTACVHALAGVLYPMHWQHIFIPVLPPHLLDYCCAPMPYLIGVHASLMERVGCRGLEEVVILNVDTNTLESPFDDLKKIPPNVALLFGSYKNALQRNQKGGGALFITMRSKANITAKSFTKPRFKNLLHKPRPRRPAQKHRTPRNVEKAVDAQINWQGLAAEPDPELERDETEEVDPLLYDPEAMDLLGEIFDTLGSRSSREHGLLYGTRSLDLFGPDSQDYIIKDRRATPSQESLSLSISGSESLHSWTLEEGLHTTEEESESPKEFNWLCPHPNGQDKNVNEIVEKQEGDMGNTELDTAQSEDVNERGGTHMIITSTKLRSDAVVAAVGNQMDGVGGNILP